MEWSRSPASRQPHEHFACRSRLRPIACLRTHQPFLAPCGRYDARPTIRQANRRSTMRAIGGLEPGWGLTVLRIAMGLVFAVHGYAKFAACLGKTSAFFAKVSIPLPELMGPVIALLELIGGILLVLGWATRWLGLLFAMEMLVATFWVQMPAKGWNGSELERVLLAGGITLFFTGAGKLAIDQVWPKKGFPFSRLIW